MPSIVGNIIAIAVLFVVLFFCGRNVVRDIRGELSGSGCAGCTGSCGGGCSGCAGNCASCSGCASKKA